MAAKKTYVIDTSVCLTDYSCIESFGNNDIVLPLKVLEEIDKHKKRQDGVGLNARSIIRKLDELRMKGNLQKGVRIGKGKGLLRVVNSDLEQLPDSLDKSIPDNNILSTALFVKKENIKRKTILVSRDINMRVICDSLGMESEDFRQNQVIKEQTDLFSGFKHLVCDEQVVDAIYNKETVFLNAEEYPGLCSNQFLMMVSSGNEKKTALVRFKGYDKSLRHLRDQKREIWGITPRNKEQMFALDLLMDPDIKLVSLVGRAGSGKTLVAVAAAMEQTINGNMSVHDVAKGKHKSDCLYKKIVVSRPVMPVGKDIGFLPGDIREKMAPWIAPIYDNLKFLTDDNQKLLETYLDNSLIEIEAVTYIRGRSIANAFIIVDEAQNLTQHEIKTILTRVGEGTKIILTGDIEQIDNIYIDSTSSGLVYAIERLKDYDFVGHITLTKGERSTVATVASKVL